MSPLPECYPCIPLWAIFTVLALWMAVPVLYVLLLPAIEQEAA